MTPSAPSVRLVVIAAAAAALFELVVLRLLTRTAVFIPGVAERIGVVGAVGELGRLGFSVSLALLAAGIVGLAVLALRRGTPVGRALSVALLAFTAVALAARLGVVPSVTADLATLGAVALLASVMRTQRRSAAVGVIGFSLAFLLAGFDAAWRNAGGEAAIAGAGGVLLGLAEWLVLGAAVGTLVARRRSARASLVVGAIVGAALVAGLAMASATVRILLLWNLGLPGAMPAAAYGVAAMAVVVVVMDAARRGRWATAAGVTLLVAGGVGLHSTYQSGLVIVGLTALALRDVLDGRGWEAASAGQVPSHVRRRPRSAGTTPGALTEELP